MASTLLTLTGVFAIMNGIVPALAQDSAVGPGLSAEAAALWCSPPPWWSALRRGAARSAGATDILLLNEHELGALTGTESVSPATALVTTKSALNAIGISRAVVTLGADGAPVFDEDGREGR